MKIYQVRMPSTSNRPGLQDRERILTLGVSLHWAGIEQRDRDEGGMRRRDDSCRRWAGGWDVPFLDEEVVSESERGRAGGEENHVFYGLSTNIMSTLSFPKNKKAGKPALMSQRSVRRDQTVRVRRIPTTPSNAEPRRRAAPGMGTGTGVALNLPKYSPPSTPVFPETRKKYVPAAKS